MEFSLVLHQGTWPRALYVWSSSCDSYSAITSQGRHPRLSTAAGFVRKLHDLAGEQNYIGAPISLSNCPTHLLQAFLS